MSDDEYSIGVDEEANDDGDEGDDDDHVDEVRSISLLSLTYWVISARRSDR
jgi:hypothetical protein